MRPEQFLDFIVPLAQGGPGAVRVQTLADSGDTQHPFGIAVTRGGGEERWQVIGQLAPGEKHDTPSAAVTGDPATGPLPAADAPSEEWLAGIILAAASPEISAVTRWSTREDARPGHIGLTVDYHNGARTFIRAL
ncbi:hypothetical protein ACIP44_22905 [Streptomyces diastaticus]|uniref:hypothetical protein n=1 Tax=Streptomyces TaxID=1883 RepID=UPI0018ACFC83|nr:hypothetical protein [Streptomyces sp. BRB081]MBL3805425.1 hypothetical protein [Streptomyces sp. BRB081]